MPPVHPDEAELKEKVSGQVEALSADGIETTIETTSVVLGGPAPAIAEIARGVGADAAGLQRYRRNHEQ